MRKFTLFLAACLSLCSVVAETTSPLYIYTQGVSTGVMIYQASSNNRYFVGAFDGSSMLYDYQTGTVTDLYFPLTNQYNSFCDVTNEGVVVGGFGSALEDALPCTFTNGVKTDLTLATLNNITNGIASATSGDGQYIVGYVGDNSYNYMPTLWTNDTIYELPMPATDIYGEAYSGGVADQVSDDGRVIAGRLYNSMYEENGVVWRFDTATNVYVPSNFGLGILYDFTKNPSDFDFVTEHYLDMSSMRISGNGRYLMVNDVEGDLITGTVLPTVFDLVNNDSIVYSGLQSSLGLSVSNNGIATVAAPVMPNPYRYTYVYEAGNCTNPIELTSYLSTKCNFNSWPTTYLPASGNINISDDETTFYGYTLHNDLKTNVNIYIAPTQAVATPEVSMGNNTEIANSIVSDNILRINGEVTSVRIFDTAGRVVLTEQNNNNINLSAIAAGLYLVETTDTNNAVATLRIVKK